jgi:hypothetical protein
MSIVPIMRPATGIYVHAAKPYRGFFRSVYMSNKLIFEGKVYRLVGVFSDYFGKRLKKFLIVNERGDVIRDRELSWKCLQIYEFFVVVHSSEKLMKHLSQPDMDYLKDLSPYIEDLFEGVRETVNDQVFAEFEKFKVFFSHMEQSDLIMHEYAMNLLPFYQEYINGKAFHHAEDFSSFRKNYIQFYELNCQRSIWLLEYALPRSIVENTFTRKEHLNVLTPQQKEAAKNLLDFLRGCDSAERDLVYTVPYFKNFEQSILYLKSISGDFSITNTDKTFKRWVS